MSESDIESMIRDAENHKEQDQARREEIDSKNSIESLTHQIKKLIEENEEKISIDIKEEFSQLSSNEISSMNIEELKEHLQKLQSLSGKIAQSLYESTEQGTETPEGANETEGNDEEVIDVNFE